MSRPVAAARPAGAGAALPRQPVAAAPVLLGLAVLVAAEVALLVVRPGGPGAVVWASDVSTTASACAAAAACGLSACRHPPELAAFWRLLAAACLAWGVGEATWTWYEAVLGVEVPSPSWADLGYLAGIPLAVAAFLCHPAARHRDGRAAIPLLDGLSVATAVLLTSWLFVLGPLVAGAGGVGLGDVVTLAYPFGDAVLLVLVVLALRGLPPGNRAATGLLLGGLAVLAAADTGYTYLAEGGDYETGGILDAGWSAAYLAIGAAALIARASGPATAGAPGTSRPLLGTIAPYLPVLTGLVLVAVTVPRRGLTGVEWAISLTLAVLVAVRQSFFVAQLRPFERRTTPPAARPATAGPVPAAASWQGAQHPADSRAEMQALALQIAMASRPTAQERAGRVSNSLVVGLAAVAAALSLWDLGLLVRGAS